MDLSGVLKAKVCLVGEMAVGKSSLIRRFVQHAYDGKYVSTLGVSITRKALDVPDARGGPTVAFELMLWDVMGRRGVHDSYLHAASGVLAVCDLTRPETLEALPGWIEDSRREAGTAPAVIAANKADLTADVRLSAADVTRIAEPMGAEWLPTSAKTGENVEEIFRRLATQIVLRTRDHSA